jgi:hypothetical protein
MTDPTSCPSCQADFTGPEIPEKDRSMFGGHTNFSRVIGLTSWEHDRTEHWMCPDCKHTWDRVP